MKQTNKTKQNNCTLEKFIEHIYAIFIFCSNKFEYNLKFIDSHTAIWKDETTAIILKFIIKCIWWIFFCFVRSFQSLKSFFLCNWIWLKIFGTCIHYENFLGLTPPHQLIYMYIRYTVLFSRNNKLLVFLMHVHVHDSYDLAFVVFFIFFLTKFNFATHFQWPKFTK